MEMIHVRSVKNLHAGFFHLFRVGIASHIAAAHVETELLKEQGETAHPGAAHSHEMDVSNLTEIYFFPLHLGFPFQTVRLHKTL